jgi:GH15 family glucan-1,4-alpha-glucosidase
VAEQIHRSTGKQTAAADLTWNYANILSALKERAKVSEKLAELKRAQTS